MKLIYICAFMTALVVSVIGQCPTSLNVSPCHCTDVSQMKSLHCKNISSTDLLVDVLDRSSNHTFRKLELYSSNLAHLPSASISDSYLQYIDLANVTMTSLFDHVPDIDNEIRNITIANSKFLEGIGWRSLNTLQKLKSFRAVGTSIKYLDKFFADSLGGWLESLYLEDTGVRKIHNNAFARLGELREVEVVKSNVATLRRSMFARPSKLRKIRFTESKICHLPNDLLTDMPELTDIDLSNNSIAILSKSVFGAIYSQLSSLNLDGNPLMCDCTMHWVLSQDRNKAMGTCAFPEELKGKPVQDLTETDFSECRT